MHGTVWEIARLGNTAGIEINATFHPDRLTTRMRNAIKRMVTTGQLSGGWQSQAKRLARALCDKYGVPYNQSSAYNVLVAEGTPEYLRAQLIDLLKADEVALRMEGDGRLHGYYTNRYEKDREALRHGAHCSVRFHCKAFGQEACSLLTDFVQKHGSDIRKRVCALLDGKEPIELASSYNY